jgi:hypothetical protein
MNERKLIGGERKTMFSQWIFEIQKYELVDRLGW